MWDNRCTMHYAVQDYDRTQLRSLQRCTLVAPVSGRFLILGDTWASFCNAAWPR